MIVEYERQQLAQRPRRGNARHFKYGELGVNRGRRHESRRRTLYQIDILSYRTALSTLVIPREVLSLRILMVVLVRIIETSYL